MHQTHFTDTLYSGVFRVGPSNAANEISENGHHSASVRDICEIFASILAFLQLGHQMLPMTIYQDRPFLPWKQNLRQKGYNSDSVRDIFKTFSSTETVLGRAIE